MQCPRCDTEIERTVSYCPECGLDIEALRERMRKESSGDGGDSDERSAGESATAADQPTSTEQTKEAETDAEPGQRTAAGASQNADSEENASAGATTDADGTRNTPTDSATGDGSPTAASGSGAGTASRTSGQSGDRNASTSNGQPTSQSSGRSGSRGTAGAAASQTAGAGGHGTQQTDSEFSFPLVQGAIYGAIAFVVNYAVVFGMFMYEMSEQTGQYTSEQFEVYELAGWIFYGSHNVDMQGPTGGETFNYLETIYSSLGEASTLPKIAYYVVPAVVLFLAGRVVAQKAASARPLADDERLKAGATVAAGYAALAVAAAATVFSVTLEGSQSATIEPKLQSAVIFMGLAYPVVAGGIGGYLAD